MTNEFFDHRKLPNSKRQTEQDCRNRTETLVAINFNGGEFTDSRGIVYQPGYSTNILDTNMTLAYYKHPNAPPNKLLGLKTGKIYYKIIAM